MIHHRPTIILLATFKVISPYIVYEYRLFLGNLLAGTRKIWGVTPNFILVGHVQEVADTTSLEDCALACLNAEKNFSFKCQSAMWYPSDPDQNCLLNSETRDTQPDVFVPEDQGVNMLYFDIGRESAKQEKGSLPFRVCFVMHPEYL